MQLQKRAGRTLAKIQVRFNSSLSLIPMGSCGTWMASQSCPLSRLRGWWPLVFPDSVSHWLLTSLKGRCITVDISELGFHSPSGSSCQTLLYTRNWQLDPVPSFWLCRLGYGLKICILNQFPGDTDAAGPGTTVWETLPSAVLRREQLQLVSSNTQGSGGMGQLPGGTGRSRQGSNNVVTGPSLLRNLRYMGRGKLTQKGCRGVSVLRWQPSFCYGKKGEKPRGCRKRNSTTVGCQVVWVKS